MKKTQKLLITADSDGDVVIWNVHRDLTMTRTGYDGAHDVYDIQMPVLDLRSGDALEYGPGEFTFTSDINRLKDPA